MKKWRKIYNENISFLCPYCLKQLPLSEATVEHEPPKSREKECGNSKKYLVCKTCNNEKGALTLQEYIEWKKLNEIRVHGVQR